jgi:glycine/serine hydroxymethyltransferase
LGKKEFKELAEIIHFVLQNPDKLEGAKKQVDFLIKTFPFVN